MINVNDKFKKLASNTIIFAIGSIGSKFITFLLVPIYTNTLTTAEYGTTEIVVTAINLLIPFLSLSIQDAVLRFGLAPDIEAKKVIKNAVFIVGIGSVISCCLTPVYGIYNAIGRWAGYFSILIILNMFRTIFSLQAKAIEKNIVFTVDVLMYSLLTCGASCLFLIVFKQGIAGYFNALIIANIVSIIFLGIACGIWKDIIYTKLDMSLMRQMLTFSIPLIFNAVSWWVANSSDRLMLNYFKGAGDVGLYSVAAKIPSIITSITSIFNQAWMISSVTEYDSNNESTFFSKTFHGYNFVLILCTAITIIIIKPFMHLYVGIDFRSSWIYVPFLLVGAIFFSYANFFGAIYMSAKRNISIMLTTLVAAIANVILNYFMIPRWGIQGAVIATMISYIIVGIYRLLGAQGIVRMNINLKKTFFALILLIIESIATIGEGIFLIISGICVVVIFIMYKGMVKDFVLVIKCRINKRKIEK